jgi:ferric-dicitrate binding protein FerR (iron transport regulator)
MSLRRNRKRNAIKRATKLWGGSKVAKTGSKAAKTAARKSPGRRPAAIVAAVLGLTGVLAAARKRRAKRSELPYGPPNESVPSHETLAPAKEQAAKAA